MGQIDLVTAGDIETVRRHLGTGTVFPATGMNPGDTYLHTTLGLWIYNGFLWVQAEELRLTRAQRLGLITTQLYDGFKVYEIDTDRTAVWAGTVWQLVQVPFSTPDTVWVTPTFQNGWTNYGDATYGTARYRKHPSGQVEVQGLIAAGTIGQIAFTLPVGYRPAIRLILTTWTAATPGASRLDVTAAGEVIVMTGTNPFASICFTFFAG